VPSQPRFRAASPGQPSVDDDRGEKSILNSLACHTSYASRAIAALLFWSCYSLYSSSLMLLLGLERLCRVANRATSAGARHPALARADISSAAIDESRTSTRAIKTL
jgi:hypothetical protein